MDDNDLLEVLFALNPAAFPSDIILDIYPHSLETQCCLVMQSFDVSVWKPVLLNPSCATLAVAHLVMFIVIMQELPPDIC